MIQGNITVDGDLVLEQPLESYDGIVKYADKDANGNSLADYPSNSEYENFKLECKWEIFSTKEMGIDNTNEEFKINTAAYGNGVCIITFFNSKYIAQSTDYGDTWELLDMGHVSTKTAKFVFDTLYIIDCYGAYKLKDGGHLQYAGDTITFNSLSMPDNKPYIAMAGNTKVLIVYKTYLSNTLAFNYYLNEAPTITNPIQGDKETIGLDINTDIVIKNIIYNNKRFILTTNTNKAIVINEEDNSISSVNLKEEFDYVIDTGAKQIFAAKNKKYLLYTNDMSEFTKIDINTDEAINGLKYINGIYFLLTEKSEYIFISTDGINWKRISELPITSTWVDVTYYSGTYYILDNKSVIVTYYGDITGKNLEYTYDRVTNTTNCRKIIKYNTKFVIACNDSKVFISKDGKSWTDSSSENFKSGNEISLFGYKDCIYAIDGISYNMKIESKIVYTGAKYIEFNKESLENNKDKKFLIDMSGKDIDIVPFNIASSTDTYISIHNAVYNNGTIYTACGSGTSSTSLNGSIYYYDQDSNNVVTIKATVPISNVEWKDICYGNGKYIAVGYSQSAIYSTNGNSWTVFNMPEAYNWNSVCYGNDKYVAVAYNSEYAAYSTDGTSWELALLPSNDKWYKVIYGNNKFIAINKEGEQNKVIYSTDGITWNNVNIGEANDTTKIMDICYGNGKFIIVTKDDTKTNNKFFYSTDGITWTTILAPVDRAWNCIAYGGGKFVAISMISKRVNTAGIAYSEDGTNWIYQQDINFAEPNTNSAYKIISCIVYNEKLKKFYCLCEGLINTKDYTTQPLYTGNGFSNYMVYNDFYNHTIIAQDSSTEIYLLCDNGLSESFATGLTANDKIKDIIFAKGRMLVATVNNNNSSMRQLNINVATHKLTFDNSYVKDNAITNPILVYGRGSYVMVDKSSSAVIVVDLFNEDDNIKYNSNNTTLLDKILNIKFINGLFLSIGTKGLLYSDFGFKWHYKKFDNITIPDSIKEFTGDIVYIPEKQRLLLINTSLKGDSYVARYDNLIGMPRHFNDCEYTLNEIYEHLKKLLDISVVDE